MKKGMIFFIGPPLFYMIVIFILSSIPNLQPPDLGLSFEDKIAHMLEYSVLGVLLARAALWGKPPSAAVFITVFCIGMLYGISDEFHQWFVPNRFASPWDAAADMVGILLGETVYWRWHVRKGIRD
jgi:VanZ family protein